MKTTQSTPKSTFLWLLLLGLVLTCQLATAQSDTYYAHSGDSTTGYWKLFTNYANRSTSIRFFDSDHQLLYQETLAGQYVKLTKRTIRLFDSTLHQLVDKRLLARQVKRHELLASNNPAPSFPSYAVAEVSQGESTPKDFPLSPSLWMSNRGKLNVAFLNAAEERVSISFLNNMDQCLYSEHTWLYCYKRPINLSELPSGRYYLRISSRHGEFKYRLDIGPANPQYAIQAIQ